MNDDHNWCDLQAPIRSFRDVHMYAQVAMGVVAGLGLVSAVKLFTSGYMPLAGGAIVLTALALGIVYWFYGRPMQLSQTSTAVVITRGTTSQTFPLDQLSEFSATWTDIRRNGVYQNTLVRFEFGDETSTLRGRYNSFVTYDTLKYEDLQGFQADMAEVVAGHMSEELAQHGRVAWTRRLTLLPEGIEFMKKPGSDPRLIDFSEISQYELDQGLFKLAVNGSDKPNIVEKTDQWNFYPGLRLFEHLMGEATPHTATQQDLQPNAV